MGHRKFSKGGLLFFPISPFPISCVCDYPLHPPPTPAIQKIGRVAIQLIYYSLKSIAGDGAGGLTSRGVAHKNVIKIKRTLSH